jgi:hypothetical protein
MSKSNLPEWEQVLSAAAHLQEILSDATLVGGTEVAIFTQHRLSRVADHVLPDLRHKFDDVLAQLEAVAGWRTARKLHPKWHDWNRVKEICATIAVDLFQRL